MADKERMVLKQLVQHEGYEIAWDGSGYITGIGYGSIDGDTYSDNAVSKYPLADIPLDEIILYRSNMASDLVADWLAARQREEDNDNGK